MKRAVIFLFLLWNSIVCQQVFSQDTKTLKDKLEVLELRKNQVITNEKEALKKEVIEINKRQAQGEISLEEAIQQKKESAELHALNIENKLAILENSIALLNREGVNNDSEEDMSTAFLANFEGENEELKTSTPKNREKIDIRTYSNLVLAFGLNNAIIKGESLNDSPYKVGGSRFFEIGWALSTRVFNNSNAVKLKYGLSLQYNGLKPKDNMYFAEDGDQTVLEEFPENLKKSKFRMTNLVFPIHFEFGSSKKIESDQNFIYYTSSNFKIGVGGYAGFKLGNLQKLKYNQDGDRMKEKSRKDFNTNNFIYGFSAYVGKDDVSLYVKYDLNPIFNKATIDQNNVSLGIRFDL